MPLFPVCPSGYHYAGEDTKRDENTNLKGVAWKEEIARSPVYSCYKISDLNKAWSNDTTGDVPYQMTFNAAVDACAEDKGKPVVRTTHSLILAKSIRSKDRA